MNNFVTTNVINFPLAQYQKVFSMHRTGKNVYNDYYIYVKKEECLSRS